MTSQASNPLAGMRDLFEEENRRKLHVQSELQAALSLCGYLTVDTPVLEPTDIFLRKSGGELASQMYSFTEPGGRQVSLRPEFTAQVIRLYLQQQDALPCPCDGSTRARCSATPPARPAASGSSRRWARSSSARAARPPRPR